MKKILALVLALAMVFSTITVAFAEDEVSPQAKALATVGMLAGDGNGVTVEYTAKELNRLTAAISLLKLKGLEADATAFVGDANFADADTVKWAEGKNVLAYLKANPGLGFGGNEKGEFDPYGNINEQSYYKVLLETLGYKQTTAEVAGDFAWEEVLTFAESKGLAPVNAEKFTVDALAKATVAALKANTKDGKTLIATLVEAGKVTEEMAVAAGLIDETPVVTAALDSAVALGNTVVEVEFDGAVNEGAADAALYAIEGLEVNEALVVGEDLVRLTTEAMTVGKLYTLTVGDVKVNFTGIAKVSGAPELLKAESKDIEEVVLTFDMNMDYATATDVANYAITGVEVAEAEVDGDTVTLTTVGLTSRKLFTVKATNVKSVDGGLLKSDSASFYTNPDLKAPKIKTAVSDSNTRVIVTFDEDVTEESATNLDNYKIVTGTTELAILAAEWDDDEVELTTEAQEYRKYTLTVNNIADATNSANTMTKEDSETFYGKKVDKDEPSIESVEVISSNLLKVTFKDASRLDEASVLDPSNYTLTKLKDEFAVEKVEEISSETGKYVALLTVEELVTGISTLEVVNIADEYGNAMDETSKKVTVNISNFAATALVSAAYTDTDVLTLTFNKSLKEASAEDISIYEIDNGIGAPKEAKYDDDKHTVELTVAEFTLGDSYELKIAGLLDLADNEISYDEIDLGAAIMGDDGDAPELVNAYAVNKYVVALEFDKAVDFAGTTVKLAYDGGKNVTLTAKDTAEDDTVIEFSNYSTELNAEDYTIATVVGTTYTGVTDVSGNYFENLSVADYAEFAFDGSDDDAEKAELLDYTQINGTTFEITMSKEVEVVGGEVTITTEDGTYKFKTENYDATDADVEYDDVLLLTKTSAIDVDDKDVELDLSALLKDIHGISAIDYDDDSAATPAVDAKTAFEAEYEDKDEPYVVNVVAIDRFTVEIEYSEELDNATVSTNDYKVYNSDEDVDDDALDIKTVDVDGEFVTLTLDDALEGRYDYKVLITGVVKDLVGLVAEEELDEAEFYFNGTDLAPLPAGLK